MCAVVYMCRMTSQLQEHKDDCSRFYRFYRFFFLIFSSHFPVTTHGKDLVSGAYLKMFIKLWSSMTKNSCISGVHQIRGFPLPEDVSTACFQNIVLH